MKYTLLFLFFLGQFFASECEGQGVWSMDSANSNNAVIGAASCVFNGKIYVVGGAYAPIFGNGEFQNTVQIFDPVSHVWSTGDTLLDAILMGSCDTFLGKIYVFGGLLGDGTENSPRVEIYDSSNHQWSYGSPMPRGRQGHTSVIVNGKIFIIGGYGDSSNIPLMTVDVFDPIANIWDTVAPIPVPVSDGGSCVLGGKIYITGGFGGQGSYNSSENVDIYDPVANAWSVGDTMPQKMVDCSASELDGKIYVMGGDLHPQAVEIFESATHSWSIGPNMQNGRANLVSTAYDGKIYAMDGGATDAVSDNEVFTPGSSTVKTVASPLEKLVVFPNPASNEITIQVAAVGDHHAITLLDPLGREYSVTKNGNVLDISSFAAGLYFVTDGTVSAKFVKQ